MCFVKQPDPPKVEQPSRKDVVAVEDTAAVTAEAEKKKKGYSSTVATSGGGLFDAAPVKKVTLGS